MQTTAPLTCIRCDVTQLQATDGYLECRSCGAAYPMCGQVPIMLRDAVLTPVPAFDAALARQVLQAFDLPIDPLSILRVRQASGCGLRTGSKLIGTEAEQFLSRVRSTGHEVAGPVELTSGVVEVSGDIAPDYRWLHDYIPRIVAPGVNLTANLRFENVGRVPLHHAGPQRVVMSYRWRDERGVSMPHEDVRTPLPVDVAPGRQLTAPIRLKTPAAAGRYQLELFMIEETRQHLMSGASVLPIRVREPRDAELPADWSILEQAPASYEADHARARDLLSAWLEHCAPANPRVLEVGGNAYPLIAGMSGELYNIDVDLLGLQVGHMVERRRGGGVAAICAEVDALPFPRGFFNAIVVVASLHHFADPIAALRAMHERLAPNGFIAVLCEPVGHIWPGAVDPAFRTELERGVNEQSFSISEYRMMFRAAGLLTQEAVVDLNSLKIRLASSLKGDSR